MQSITDIQVQVGLWSKKNFGNQRTTLFEPEMDGDKLVVNLHYLHPLLGMGEEIGELAEAMIPAQVEDAVGDVLIYMCDFCSRLKIPIPYLQATPSMMKTVVNKYEAFDPFRQLVAWYGQLLHVMLKRSQGIRGYDDNVRYETDRTIALHFMCKALDGILTQHFGSKTNVGTTLNIVFDNAVAKRDWKSDPINARQELEIKQPSIKLEVQNGIIQ